VILRIFIPTDGSTEGLNQLYRMRQKGCRKPTSFRVSVDGLSNVKHNVSKQS
jgi:hypothetical protein